MQLTIVEKNLLSWTAMHIDFVMCNKRFTILSICISKNLAFFNIERGGDLGTPQFPACSCAAHSEVSTVYRLMFGQPLDPMEKASLACEQDFMSSDLAQVLFFHLAIIFFSTEIFSKKPEVLFHKSGL